MIKMIMISKQDRYYGLFLMNFELCVDFSAYHEAGVSIDSYPFRMTVNPLLIGLYSLSEMIYIVCHEIEHIVLNHPTEGIKYNAKKDPLIAIKLNLAMDASINDRLTMDSVTNPTSVISEPENAVNSASLRESFQIHIKEMQAFDYYFERIPNMGEGINRKLKIIWSNEDRTDEIITAKKRKGIVCLPCWTVSDALDEVEGIIRKFISDVCDGMSDTMQGNLPQHQKEALRKLLSPPSITWKQLLKRYIGTIPHGQRKTRMRLSRRQPERYDISGTIRDRIIKLVVAIDTSGSMSAEALERIMVEIFDIIGSRQSAVTVIECDATIHRVYPVRNTGDLSCDIKGRGGTSFIPVIDYVNSSRYFRDALLIYFTDGCGDRAIPRPLVRRIMWVLHDEQCRLSLREPFGEVLVMD